MKQGYKDPMEKLIIEIFQDYYGIKEARPSLYEYKLIRAAYNRGRSDERNEHIQLPKKEKKE